MSKDRYCLNRLIGIMEIRAIVSGKQRQRKLVGVCLFLPRIDDVLSREGASFFCVTLPSLSFNQVFPLDSTFISTLRLLIETRQ